MSVFSGSVHSQAAAPFLRLRPWGCAAQKGGGRGGAPPQKGIPLRGRAAAKGARSGPRLGARRGQGRAAVGGATQKGGALKGQGCGKRGREAGPFRGPPGPGGGGRGCAAPKGGCRGKGGAGGVPDQKTDKKFRKPSLSRPGSCDIISKSGVFSKN